MPKALPSSGNLTGHVSLLYNPSQQAFLDALALRTPNGKRAYHRLLVCSGRRGGKTKIGGIAAAREASVPNTLGWACAPSYPELHDYVLPSLRQAIPQDWIENWSEQHQEFRLINGSIIQLRSLDDPERGRGPGLHWLWIDEARKIPEQSWKVVQPALVDKPGIVFVTTTPNGYDWVFKTFWRPAVEQAPGFWAIKYKTSDNPSIRPEELEEARATTDAMWFKQEYEADFVNFTGSIYDSKTLSGQIILGGDERRFIPEWPDITVGRSAIVAMDPGTDHPFAATLMVLTEHGLVCCGEYLERHRTIADHVDGIRKMVRGLAPQYGYDRAAKQFAIELAQHGIYAQPCENSVEAGIRRVESWLKAGKLWFFESAVPRTVAQMQTLRWADNYDRSGQKRHNERVYKVDDDLPDAVRYCLQMWPELPEPAKIDMRRSLDSFPDDVRWAVERERRLGGWDAPEVNDTGVSDFYTW